MPVRKIHKAVPVIFVQIMIPSLMVMTDMPLMNRMLRQRFLPFLHSFYPQKPVNGICLNAGFKLPLRIRPAVKGFRCGVHQPGSNKGQKHMLIKGKGLLIIFIFLIITAEPVGEADGNVS